MGRTLMKCTIRPHICILRGSPSFWCRRAPWLIIHMPALHASVTWASGRGGGPKLRCWMLNLFSLRLGLSTSPCWPFKIWQKEKAERRRWRQPTSRTLQSAVWTKLLWTTSFRVEGSSHPGWQLHGDKVQLALVGVERCGGGLQIKVRPLWWFCSVENRFLSRAFSSQLLAPVRVNGIFNSLVWVEGRGEVEEPREGRILASG